MNYLLVPELAGEEMDSPFIGSDGRHHFRIWKWMRSDNHLDQCRSTKRCGSGSPACRIRQACGSVIRQFLAATL
jgi:hypothetical protein